MQILVGTDLSDRSRTALRRAAELATAHGARLTLLHVVDDDQPPEMTATQHKWAQNWLVEHLPDNAHAVPHDVLVREGDPHSEIQAVGDELDADLIVLGAHRKRLLRDAFIGTTAERLLHVSTRPVLIAHSQDLQPYRRVLAATDLSDASAKALLAAQDIGLLSERASIAHVFYAGAKGKLQQSGIEPAAHIASERERAARDVDGFLRERGLDSLRHRVLLREGRAAHEIRSLVTEISPDLLILGTRGRAGMKRVVLGSVTEALLRSVPCDVLAVPPGRTS